MFKRLSAFLLALILALGLSACGQDVSGGLPSGGTSPVLVTPESEPAPSGPAREETENPAEAQTANPDDSPETPAEEAFPELPAAADVDERENSAVVEDGSYNSKEDVALYIHLYGHLPGNYLTKKEAEDLGWTGGSVERYAGEGAAIGGSRFGNYEGLLPRAEGRTYTECDIDTVGASSRGPKRVVFSNDGLVYYTGDHYESFELLYGEP